MVSPSFAREEHVGDHAVEQDMLFIESAGPIIQVNAAQRCEGIHQIIVPVAIRIQHDDLARNALGEVVNDVTWTKLRRACVGEQGQDGGHQRPGKRGDQVMEHVAKVEACTTHPGRLCDPPLTGTAGR